MCIKEISLSDEKEENGTKEKSTKVTKSKREVTIEVLNATSRNGLASSVAEKLKEEGYNVTKIGNYKTTSNMATTVISRTDDTEYAKKVKSFLGIGTVKTEKEEVSKVDITVILGSDYK
jgi:calcineurin-like phosphoesterase